MSAAFAELAVGRAVVLSLAAARSAGLVAVSPWPGKMTPSYARGALALALGSCALSLDLAPEGATSFAPPLGGPWWTGLALGCAAEVGCGLLMGFVMRLAFSAVDVLGAALSYALGLSTPVVPDPESGTNEPPIARLLTLGAVALALGAGVHREVLGRLLASFRALPPGVPLALMGSVPEIVDFAGASIAAGVSLALPFVATALAVQIVLALVARAAPALQLFSVGFTLLTLAGLSMLSSALEGLAARLLAHIGQAGAWIDAALAAAAGGLPSMSEADAGDRKYDATPNRREKFLKEGRFPKARDAGGVAATAAALGALYSMGDSLIDQARHLFGASLGDLTALSRGEGGGALRAAIAPWVAVVLPIALGSALAATVVGFAQAGVAFRPEHIGFKFDRLDPVGRLKQLLSPKHMATEGPLSLVRVAVVGYVAYAALLAEAPALERLGGLHASAGLALAAGAVASVATKAAAALAGLALVDYAISKFKLEREMKMTLQELKEESRSEEGDQKVKGRIRARARALARKRMMNDVKKADVVVANPTHVSVALRYGAGDVAPVVLAKGVDEAALAIRTLARRHGIPIVESRALARALEAEVQVGHPVPGAHYAAVAQVLAFVFKLRRGRAR